jgi:hypothetical protein
MTKLKANNKTSIRLALTDPLKAAFDLIKRTKYPFLKEDEILKLALSNLYAAEHIISNKHTTVSYLIAKIRTKIPNFGKAWIKENNLNEEDIDQSRFAEMVYHSIKYSELNT